MIVVNQVRCKKCGDTPFSRHRHDFVWCKCGNIAVDGGMDYLRRVGGEAGYEEMSYELPKELVDACTAAVDWGKENGRNSFGIALAVLRAVHEHERLVVGDNND